MQGIRQGGRVVGRLDSTTLTPDNATKGKKFCVWIIHAGKTVETAKLNRTDYLDRMCDKRFITDQVQGMDDARGAQAFARTKGAALGDIVAFFPCAADGHMVSGMAFQPQVTVLWEDDNADPRS